MHTLQHSESDAVPRDRLRVLHLSLRLRETAASIYLFFLRQLFVKVSTNQGLLYRVWGSSCLVEHHSLQSQYLQGTRHFLDPERRHGVDRREDHFYDSSLGSQGVRLCYGSLCFAQIDSHCMYTAPSHTRQSKVTNPVRFIYRTGLVPRSRLVAGRNVQMASAILLFMLMITTEDMQGDTTSCYQFQEGGTAGARMDFWLL